jgi:hypothetical protein
VDDDVAATGTEPTGVRFPGLPPRVRFPGLPPGVRLPGVRLPGLPAGVRVPARVRDLPLAVRQFGLPAAAVILLFILGGGVSAAVVTGDPMAPVYGVSKVVSKLPGVNTQGEKQAAVVEDNIRQADSAVEHNNLPQAQRHLSEARGGLPRVPRDRKGELTREIDKVDQAAKAKAATPTPGQSAKPTPKPSPSPTTAPTTAPPSATKTPQPTTEPPTSSSTSSTTTTTTTTAPAASEKPAISSSKS